MSQIPHTKIKILRSGIFANFALIVIILSVTRGFLPLITRDANLAQPIYYFSFSVGALFSLLGLKSALFNQNQVIPKRLRTLLILNFILNALWLFPILILKPDLTRTLGFVYVSIFPFAIYGFTRLSAKQLFIAVGICTLSVAGSVIWDFIELNTTLVPNGIDLTINRQLLLRPTNFETISTTGELLRPAGILGPRPHDAANLLAIISTYLIALILQKGGTKTTIYALSAVSVTALLMTQVASNILAFFVGILFYIFAYRKTIFKHTSILKFSISLLVGISTVYIYTEYSGMDASTLWQWALRIAPTGDWAGMTSTGITNIRTDLLAAIIGHGTTLGYSEVGKVAESSFIKLLMELGILPFTIFMLILSYPIRQYISMQNRNKHFTLPYVAAILVGFVSLWHYGSVLTTTNEFVFLALYARALIIFADERESQQLNGLGAKEN